MIVTRSRVATSGDVGYNKVIGTIKVAHAMFKANMVKRVAHFNRLRINLPQAFLDRVGDATRRDFSSVMRGWLPASLPEKFMWEFMENTCQTLNRSSAHPNHLTR